jgi:hypothetical protein
MVKNVKKTTRVATSKPAEPVSEELTVKKEMAIEVDKPEEYAVTEVKTTQLNLLRKLKLK